MASQERGSSEQPARGLTETAAAESPAGDATPADAPRQHTTTQSSSSDGAKAEQETRDSGAHERNGLDVSTCNNTRDRNKRTPNLMQALPDVVKSCEDLSEEKDTQTDSVEPVVLQGALNPAAAAMAPAPVAVAIVDPASTNGSLGAALNHLGGGPPATPPSHIPLVNLNNSQDQNGFDDEPIAVISGTLPEERRTPGDGTDADLGDGSRALAFKEGRSPAEARAAALLSANDPGNAADNLGYDSIHLDVVGNGNGYKLQDSVSMPGSSDLDFEIDVPTSPDERDSESPEKDAAPPPPKVTSWRDVTSTQRFILAALMMGNIFSAVFYSLLAPFFPTEVRTLCVCVCVCVCVCACVCVRRFCVHVSTTSAHWPRKNTNGSQRQRRSAGIDPGLQPTHTKTQPLQRNSAARVWTR